MPGNEEQRCASPDRAGADIGLAEHLPALRRFVRRLVARPDLAEDIVQETLLRACTAGAAFAGRSQPATWLAAIALNVLRDHYRKPATRNEVEADDTALAALPAPEEDPVLALMMQEMGACIVGYLMELPERQREVLALHDMAGASHGEIAAALGIAEGHARVVLHRARAALRELLSRHCRLDFKGDAVPCSPRPERREE